MAPTYVFENDRVYAMQDGKVLAHADDADALDAKLAELEEDSDECDGNCEGECTCGKKSSVNASHIVTPNGLKGKILGKVKDVWGEEEVTVRLENGRIAHVKVADADIIEEEGPEAVAPINRLEEVLDEETVPLRDELLERKDTLASVQKEARNLIHRGASSADIARLDRIVVTADHEQGEIDERLDYLNSETAEAYAPPAPYDMNVVEQGGRPGGSEWLDTTLDDMISEAEDYDYQKLMDEGPEAFVAEQDDGVIADQGAMQGVAASFIREKTAAADPTVREKYEKSWLARVEKLRRKELTNRKETQKKEAAVTKDADDNAPDASLFL